MKAEIVFHKVSIFRLHGTIFVKIMDFFKKLELFVLFTATKIKALMLAELESGQGEYHG